MQRAYCCCLALLLLAAPLHARSQETPVADRDFLDLNLEELLTLKIDPNIASILDSHIHRAGERMLSYRFMTMAMSGGDLTSDEILDDFMVAPTSMTMDMHMVSAMYALTDRFTLMLMLPYRNLSMDHVTRMGQTFSVRSSGLSDVGLMGNFVMHKAGPHRIILHGGLTLPTGSINITGDTPAGANQMLPYPMQLGSGTYDLHPGLMYQGVTERWVWGAQLKSMLRLGKNSNNYRLGNRLEMSSWVGYAWTPAISNILHLEGRYVGNIHGADADLNPNMVPTADPRRSGGRNLDLHFVTEYYNTKGMFEGMRISLEFTLPVYESHDPTQLENVWSLGGAIQWTF